MIQACIIFFQDGPRLLERCFKSLVGKVDKIVAIDGAFADFKHDKPWSTDGCLDIARRYADTLIECKEAWPSQIAKRNSYLTLKNPNDLYLIIDSDEYLKGFIDPTLEGEAFALDLIDRGTPNLQIRLFRHRDGLEYREKHAWVWLGKRIINHPDYTTRWKKIDTCSIIHTPGDRGEYRLTLDNEYVQLRKEPARPDNYRMEPEHKAPAPEVVYMVFQGERYDGWDGMERVEVTKGMTAKMTKAKSVQLLTDFPGDWLTVLSPADQAIQDLKERAGNGTI